MSKQVKRLFPGFQPSHYQIDLNPNRETMQFRGSVVLRGLKRGRPTQRITLHQHRLKITSATIVKHDKTGDHQIAVDRINNHASFDEVRLHTNEKLFPGDYSLTLSFEGKITEQMEGLYPCLFTHAGKEKKLLATQFESHHAREVFPCIDEPEAKATFQLSLVVPEGETAISNTPIESQKPNKPSKDGFKSTTVLFEQTPRMSTYLLAFVFGEMGYLEARTKAGVVVRTYATPDNVAHTTFALDFAVKCLEFYEDYFGIPYPLKKCDFIALPDFASGAMENWGCITFREQSLIVDEKNTSLSTKQYVAMVVAHELAHMWFGNLVTMRWWTDLWLNEGFASWIEFLAVDHIFPKWNMWTQFIIDEQQQALKLDSLENTHPVEVAVKHPDEIRSIFDAISYSKGASIIHMLHSYLGPADFQAGLRYYLQKHAYGNTVTADLWDALEHASKKPVRAFMHSWTSEPGFPLLQATIKDKQVKIDQQRFYSSPSHPKRAAQIWPVALLSPQLPDSALLEEKTTRFDIHSPNTFKLNQGQSGYFRVAYDSAHIARLGDLVKQDKLDPLDRLGILADMSETAKAGYASSVDTLTFLAHFAKETDYAVWDAMTTVIGSIRHVMDDELVREAIKPFIRQLVGLEYARLGWDRQPDESHFDQLLRPIILSLASSADDPEVIARCRQLFMATKHTTDIQPDHKANPGARNVRRGAEIDPDLRGTVYGTMARHGGQAEFEKMLRLHNETTLSEERVTLSAALSGFKQPEIIKQSLAVIDTKNVRFQDVPYWIAYSFLNRHAKHLAWDWMKTHWDWLEESLGSDLSFYRMPIYAGRAFTDDSFIPEFKEFFEPRLKPAMERSYRQAIEIIEWQSAWKKRDLQGVRAFLVAKQNAPKTK